MKLLLVDYNNLFYRSVYAHQGLSYNGLFTGGIYGFVTQLANAVLELSPDALVFMTDTPPYLRSQLLPEYKEGRVHVEDDPDQEREMIMSNERACREFIKVINTRLVRAKGYEADDLIASMCHQHASKFEAVYVFSNDTDLRQLLDQKNVYLWRGKQKGLYGLSEYRKEFPGLNRGAQWIMVTALSGGHNGMVGVKRVGEKTAIKIMRDKKKWEAVYRDHEELINLNVRLSVLPFESRYGKARMPIRWVSSARDVARFVARYGIRMTPWMRRAFDRQGL